MVFQHAQYAQRNPGMNAVSDQLFDGFPFQAESSQSPLRPKPAVVLSGKVAQRSRIASKDAVASVVAFPVPQSGVSRHIDWYVQGRRLPTLIADFLDTHWRLYTVRCCLIDGEESESYRETLNAMKDLAWSVRPKRDPLNRRRLVALIPQLYQRLHVGLESLGFGTGTTQHDVFFAELAKLHQAALHLKKPVTV